MRIWLQKQKKKEEAKAAAQAATPVVETTPAATEAPSEVESADKPIDSVEEAPVTGSVVAEPAAAATDTGDGEKRTVSASAQPNEVGLRFLPFAMHNCVYDLDKNKQMKGRRSEALSSMNTVDLARAGGCSMYILPSANADVEQDSTTVESNDPERCGSMVPQAPAQGVEATVGNASSGEQNSVNGPASMMGNNPMMNGMQGQMGFGFQSQGNFGGMGFNGMSNMMNNASWNNMNPMGMSIEFVLSQILRLIPAQSTI